jgi:NADH:ubiquinone oxidoreductase subunit F (NADH-binding)
MIRRASELQVRYGPFLRTEASALGDAAAWPIQGLIRHFRPELERRINERLPEAAE